MSKLRTASRAVNEAREARQAAAAAAKVARGARDGTAHAKQLAFERATAAQLRAENQCR